MMGCENVDPILYLLKESKLCIPVILDKSCDISQE